MKLSKDQVQKIFLGGMMLVGILYAYSEFLLGPLHQEEENAKANAAKLDPQILEAKKQTNKTKTLEAQGPESSQIITQISDMIPEGSPVAWLPPRLADFFKKQGVDKVTARMNNELPDKDMTGFRRISWTIDIPNAEFLKVAAAVSSLENEEPLFELQSVDVETNRETVQFQHMTVTLISIARQ